MNKAMVCALGIMFGMFIAFIVSYCSWSSPYRTAYSDGYRVGRCDERGGTVVDGVCSKVSPLWGK